MKLKHGGRRPGAGRPTQERKDATIQLRLSSQDASQAQQLARGYGMTISQLLRTLIREDAASSLPGAPASHEGVRCFCPCHS